MKRLLFTALMAVSLSASAQQARIVRISNLFTTHLVFDTEIKYGDLSNTEQITASVVERSRNMLSMIALEPFEKPANVTVLESNGNIHTFVLEFGEYPEELIVDLRSSGASSSAAASSAQKTSASGAGVLWRGDAPALRDVLALPQSLYHLAVKSGRVSLICSNVFTYSDITYIVLSVENGSGVSFEVSDATFRVEPRDSHRRRLVNGSNVLPQNREGTLTAAAGGTGKAAYALDKLTLSEDQVLIIDVYETGGQRHLELTLSCDDINLAAAPLKRQ